jgi:hypothetical protein
MCSKHYNRRLTTGSVEDGPRARAPVDVRLWRQVDRRGPDECWLWTAKRRIKGYGVINWGGRGSRPILAHRLAWILTNGPIPDGEGAHGTVVMHTCDNRLCCNPAHLRLGTQGDNVKDMDAKGRRKSAPKLGSKHHNARLNEAKVRYIRASTKSNAELAREFGVTRQAVRWARKKGWQHV